MVENGTGDEPSLTNEKRTSLVSSPGLGQGEAHEEAVQLEVRVWKRMDMYVLPVVTMFYLLSFLDRANVGNARVAGLQKDLKMTNKEYSIALTVTYVPYIVAELPSNLLLKYVGANFMLPTLVMLWGLVTTLQGTVTTYGGLLTCRFFLGLLEGGVFPGIVLYLSGFYPRQRLQMRISGFFASASLSGAFSGLLAAAIIKMDGVGGKPGWAWIFILEGMFTFLFGFASYFLIPRSPMTARFLNPRERAYVEKVLRADGAIAANDTEDHFSWAEVGRCLTSPQVWFVAVAFFFDGTTLYSLAYFAPTIVQGLRPGSSAVSVQLFSVPPFAAAFFVTLATAYLSDRYRCRGLISIFCAVLCLTGFSMFLGTESKSIQYGSLFLSISGTYCAAPALSAWASNNSAPHIRRATTIALGFIMTNSGGILATWLLGSISPAPKYTTATITFVVFSIGMIVFPVINLIYLMRKNKEKAAIRATSNREDEPKHLGDKSAWFVYNL